MEKQTGFMGIPKMAWLWVGGIVTLGALAMILALILLAFGVNVPVLSS
ncbi:MAG: hypothetical protein JSU65_07655 [Candidatus Zixiibacteriota bacterium]|nr:MAG: hypothetical protein JSU65_07655 [candidate division Zixibacteria bacterium]